MSGPDRTKSMQLRRGIVVTLGARSGVASSKRSHAQVSLGDHERGHVQQVGILRQSCCS
uniref:Uncharacterized protein n=1 Tax=uncultured marine virus TaxID=186617 RepID=A0A0F7L3C5_9VIRU|nr:hypothetical protein [uncultured marine virus]